MKIEEIFLSIQGEGLHVGSQAVFVRFSGCNLSCSFCDENRKMLNASNKNAPVEMSVKKIIEEIKSLIPSTPMSDTNRHRIVFTGGEPLLQLTSELAWAARDIGDIDVETNCTVEPDDEDLLRICDCVTVSPKNTEIKSSVLLQAHTLKMLFPFPGNITVKNVVVFQEMLESHGKRMASFFLQPISDGNNPVDYKATIEMASELGPAWRIVPQIHKIMGLK